MFRRLAAAQRIFHHLAELVSTGNRKRVGQKERLAAVTHMAEHQFEPGNRQLR